MTAATSESSRVILRWQRTVLTVGAVAALACILGGTVASEAFCRAYLCSYIFVLGLALGGLAVLMIHHLTGGAWGFLLRRILEAEMRTLPLVAILFLPIAFGLEHIYPWAAASAGAHETGETLRQWYLQPERFFIRSGIYFAVWLTIAGLLSLLSRKADQSDDAGTAWKSYKLSGVGLVVLGISLHFAAVDWIMSVDPGFVSTIFGPLVFTGQILSAFAAAVLTFCLLSSRPEYHEFLSEKALSDMGSLLFTMLIAWAYMAWFQFMLIWMADLPHGAAWYLARGRDGWQWMTLALFVFHFVIPFALLLLRVVKRNPRRLAAVAALILVTQIVYEFYQVIPSYSSPTPGGSWLFPLMVVALCGIWLAAFMRSLSRHPLLPQHDLNRPQAIYLRGLDDEELEREELLSHG